MLCRYYLKFMPTMPNKVKTFTVLQLRAQIQKGKGAGTQDPGDPRPGGQGSQNTAVPPFGQWWGSQDCGQERTGDGVENVPRGEAGDPGSSTVRGRGHCAFREAVGWRPSVLAAGYLIFLLFLSMRKLFTPRKSLIP